MSKCKHSYYQSPSHAGHWWCEGCDNTIESWQHHNLVISERDKLRDRVRELEEDEK